MADHLGSPPARPAAQGLPRARPWAPRRRHAAQGLARLPPPVHRAIGLGLRRRGRRRRRAVPGLRAHGVDARRRVDRPRRAVPVFVFPIVGGAVADALERRRLTIVTHAVLAVMSLLLAVNALLDEPLLWPLYVFAFVSAGLYTFNRPALDTWPARLLDPRAVALGQCARGRLRHARFDDRSRRGRRPARDDRAGGRVRLRRRHVPGRDPADRPHAPSPPSDDENEVSWEAIKDGFRFLKGKRNLQSVFLADLNAMVFGFPVALFPAVAERLGGR